MNLIVPVYLNQSYVFDLLAMLKGGLATVTSIKKMSEEGSSHNANLEGGFGLSGALGSLFKVNMSTKIEAGANAAEQKIESEDRVHTPASLLFQLLGELRERDFLKKANDKNLSEGDLVEFECTLSKNPMLESLNVLSKFLDLVEQLSAPAQNAKGRASQKSEITMLRKQLGGILEDLETGETFDLVGKNNSNDINSVITISKEFLSDQEMSNLVEGKFKVMGKIIRNVKNVDSPINLVRKSSLGKAPAVMAELLKAFDSLDSGHDFDLPKAVATIDGPALHILPVAIYV